MLGDQGEVREASVAVAALFQAVRRANLEIRVSGARFGGEVRRDYPLRREIVGGHEPNVKV